MVNQLAFGMREKVHVYTQKKDTLEMLDYNYPRMYGMSPTTDILLIYKNLLKIFSILKIIEKIYYDIISKYYN